MVTTVVLGAFRGAWLAWQRELPSFLVLLFAVTLHSALVARQEVVAVPAATGVHEGATGVRLRLVVVAYHP